MGVLAQDVNSPTAMALQIAKTFSRNDLRKYLRSDSDYPDTFVHHGKNTFSRRHVTYKVKRLLADSGYERVSVGDQGGLPAIPRQAEDLVIPDRHGLIETAVHLGRELPEH